MAGAGGAGPRWVARALRRPVGRKTSTSPPSLPPCTPWTPRRDGRSRGGPLRPKDAYVQRALDACGLLVDTARWPESGPTASGAAPHAGREVWVHADVMPGNLLVRDGRLVAVIDLGAVAVTDPAVDLMPAWNLLPLRARSTYRRTLLPTTRRGSGGGVGSRAGRRCSRVLRRHQSRHGRHGPGDPRRGPRVRGRHRRRRSAEEAAVPALLLRRPAGRCTASGRRCPPAASLPRAPARPAG